MSINLVQHINKYRCTQVFDKIQHPFMKKTSEEFSYRRTYLNMIKAIYDKLIARILLNRKKLKLTPLNSGTRKEYLLSPLLFNMLLGAISREIR